jgi:hypothetical protein
MVKALEHLCEHAASRVAVDASANAAPAVIRSAIYVCATVPEDFSVSE